MLGNLIEGKIRFMPPLDNLNRIRILDICKKEPYKYNVRGLARKLEIGVKSVFHHLKILEKEKLIKIKKKKIRGGIGNFIATNTKNPLFKDFKIN